MKKFNFLFPILFSLAFSNSIDEDNVRLIDLKENPKQIDSEKENGSLSKNDESLVTNELFSLSRLKWHANESENGCEFIGNDIFSKKTINDECKDLCDKFYGCTHYTWSPLDGGVCFLKSGKVSKEDAVRTNDLRFICGFARPINPATCKVEKDWTKIQLPVTPLSSVSHCKPIDVFDRNSFSWRYSPLSGIYLL